MAWFKIILFFVFKWILLNDCISNTDAYHPSGYLGCYFTTPGKVLPVRKNSSELNDGEYCKSICSLNDYKLAGTEGSNCFCGNDSKGAKVGFGCFTKCPGNNDETCGGTNYMSVYSTTDETSISDDDSAAQNNTKKYIEESSGIVALYIAAGVGCVGLTLSVVIMFLFIRYKRRNNQGEQILAYQGNLPAKRQTSMTSAANKTYHDETHTYDDPTYSYDKNSVNINIIQIHAIDEYEICENIVENNNALVENTIKSEALKQASEYSHIGTIMPVKNTEYDDVQVSTKHDVPKHIASIDENVTYDISHTRGRAIPAEPQKAGTYSTLSY